MNEFTTNIACRHAHAGKLARMAPERCCDLMELDIAPADDLVLTVQDAVADARVEELDQ
jgi:hypothetical protein